MQTSFVYVQTNQFIYKQNVIAYKHHLIVYKLICLYTNNICLCAITCCLHTNLLVCEQTLFFYTFLTHVCDFWPTIVKYQTWKPVFTNKKGFVQVSYFST